MEPLALILAVVAMVSLGATTYFFGRKNRNRNLGGLCFVLFLVCLIIYYLIFVRA